MSGRESVAQSALKCCLGFLFMVGSSGALAVPLDVARVLDDGSAVDQAFDAGDLSGTNTPIDSTVFNAMSVAELDSLYDVLLIGCCSATLINVDWNTRLRPFLELGGGVVFENPQSNNLVQLAPAVSASGNESTENSGASGWSFANVPGLTDGLMDPLVNEHIRITSYDTSLLSAFLFQDGVIEGIYGDVGNNGGRFVLTAPDNCFHGDVSGSIGSLNAYQACVNAINWAGAGKPLTVPEPSSATLLALGLLLVRWVRRRAKALH